VNKIEVMASIEVMAFHVRITRVSLAAKKMMLSQGRSMTSRPFTVAMFVTTAISVTSFAMTGAFAQAFNPVHELSGRYTDRTPIDIEIVGSTSLLPEVHKLEPERVLRFRLERAYVTSFIAHREPGFEILSMTVDRETGLPGALFDAADRPKKLRVDTPGVPSLSASERAERRLLIMLSSDRSLRSLRSATDYVSPCRGEPLANGLISYAWEGRANCMHPIYLKGSDYLAPFGDFLLRIQCQSPDLTSVGCEVSFPFEEFAVRIAFRDDQVPRWREMIAYATSFLKSKQYR
jgi:hypothetical protein